VWGAGCGYVTAKAHDSLLWYDLFGRGAGRNKASGFPLRARAPLVRDVTLHVFLFFRFAFFAFALLCFACHYCALLVRSVGAKSSVFLHSRGVRFLVSLFAV
jgi:hypothetical protein